MAKITFGGYDLSKYAKTGSTEKDIIWGEQAVNENYWALNSKGVTLGQHPIAANDQVVVLDNGMSFALAPTKSFQAMVQNFQSSGMHCEQASPLWGCECSKEQYESLGDMKLNILLNEKGDQKEILVPRSSYMYKLK